MTVKWVLLGLIGLLIAYVLDMSLLIYAMYAIIGILFVSKWVTSRWTQAIQAERVCDKTETEIGGA